MQMPTAVPDAKQEQVISAITALQESYYSAPQ
jgi:hypothetical protein